jgi:hypothetical protein
VLEVVKLYIEKCPKCIMAKSGKFFNSKKKIIIAKDPLERVLMDGW